MKHKIKKYLKYLFISIFLISLFHFESISVSSFKISHLWKGVLLVFLLFSLVRKKMDLFIYRPLIIISILHFVNADLINSPITAITNFSIFLLIPFLGLYILKFNYFQIKQSLIFFSSIFIFSFIPYYFGFVKSLSRGYDLHSFEGSVGLVGPYQGPHGAAITLAISLIVILYFLFEGSYNKWYLLIVFVLGLIFLMNTYVRTGFLMLLVGVIPILFNYAKKSIKALISIFSIIFIFSFIVLFQINKNKVLLNRILGKSIYNSEISLNTYSSGRGDIYENSLKVFQEENLFEKIVGIGQFEQRVRLEKKMGSPYVSHNAFIDFLLKGGIISLFLFLNFIYKLLKYIFSYNDIPEKTLTISLFFGFLIMCLVQGYEWINANLILMLGISLLYKQYEKYQIPYIL